MHMNLFGLLGLAITLFAATNTDDIFVLLGFFSDPGYKVRDIVVGQYLGISALIAISLTAALIALVIPPAYIGLLGLAPIALGLEKLVDLRRQHAEPESAPCKPASQSGVGRVLSVTAVTVANGGDNIGVYTPLFAVRTGAETAVIVTIFLAMTAVWCIAGRWLVGHPTLGKPIRRYGHIALPIVLLVLGVMILHDAGSFALLTGGKG